MKRTVFLILLVGVAVASSAGGYWLGRHRVEVFGATIASAEPEAKPSAPQHADRKILYYRDPMGKPEYSPAPKKDSMGTDYIPVYEGEEEGAISAPPTSSSTAQSKGKILYYRNPMGLPDTSPVPKKDSMGMDYIPVYEDDDGDDTGTVKISLAKVQKLGVQSTTVGLRSLNRTIRAVGYGSGKRKTAIQRQHQVRGLDSKTIRQCHGRDRSSG